ncbi:MAG: T9SS type A sorting domain-containing protein [Tannerellaceae bacterium]|jgi:hypothetical protein|nr:T9SS type A sorting domain-containing protein [Tannerellaceae bacterium]
MNQINSLRNTSKELLAFALFTIIFMIVSTSVASAVEVRKTNSGLCEVTFYDAADNSRMKYNYTLQNWPEEVKQAIMAAMVITENTLQIKYTMRVAFAWSPDLDKQRCLAVSHNTYVDTRGFSAFGISVDENYKYPAELIHQLAGNSIYNSINNFIVFNSLKDWCTSSVEQPTLNQQDIITVTLHELAHGLGISSSLNRENERRPYIFDKYVSDEKGNQIGKSTLYTATKANAESQLTNANLYYSGAMGKRANDGQSIRLHAPAYLSSASICHFDRMYENDDKGRLLIPGTTYGVCTRFYGDFALGIFQDLGWKLNTNTRLDAGVESTTANEEIEQNDNITISAGAGRIHVELNGFDPQRIAIYTVAGRLVRNEVINGSASYDVPSNQIYIVRTGNQSKKVMVN